jgi:hypothetical protein
MDSTAGNWVGNAALWISLPPNGTINKDYEKIPAYRLKPGTITVGGRRLDGPAAAPRGVPEPGVPPGESTVPTPRGQVPEGYGDRGWQAMGVEFPTPGCWEVAYRLGADELRFTLRVLAPDAVRREPADLPVLPPEARLLTALRAAGYDITLVGGSKMESFLGPLEPARFIRTTAGAADVLFHDKPHVIRVCETAKDGRFVYAVTSDGKSQMLDANRKLFFAESLDVFVMTEEAGLRDAIAKALGASGPGC